MSSIPAPRTAAVSGTGRGIRFGSGQEVTDGGGPLANKLTTPADRPVDSPERRRAMSVRACAAAVVVTLVAVAAQADDAVVIKLKRPAKGDVTAETKNDQTTETITQAGGKQENKTTVALAFTDEVLEADGTTARPTRLKRTYQAAEATIRGKPADLGLKAKAVVIEKGVGQAKYAVTVDGKPPTAEAAALFDREFNRPGVTVMDDFMLPAKPVKVNDTWAVDIKDAAKMMPENMTVDAAKSKVTGKLLKVYAKDGATYGVTEHVISMAVTELKTPMGNIDAAGSVMTFTVTRDGCIDGTRYGGKTTGKVKGEMAFKTPQGEVKIAVDGTMESTTAAGAK